MDIRRQKGQEPEFTMGTLKSTEDRAQYVFQLSPSKPNVPMLRMHKAPEMTISNAWQIVRLCCSEVICTAILSFTIARSIENPPGPAAGFLVVPVSLFLGIWIGGPVSGGHINPVVTLVLCLCRWVSFIYLPIYWLSQFIGVLVGMGLAHGFTLAMLNGTEPTNLATDGQLGNFFWIHLTAETLTTTMFLLTVVSSADSKRPGDWTGSGFYTSLSVASMAFIIGLFFDARIACFVNPIVPVGTAIVFGIKTGFWAHIIGPVLGSLIAATLYQFIFCPDAGRKRAKTFCCVRNYDYSADLSHRRQVDVADQ